MSVQIVHGSNQINFDLEGLSVNEAKEILKEVLNLPSVIDAYVNCKRVGEDCVLEENDRLEFLKESGRKGAMHDFFSEEELIEQYGDQVYQRMRDSGLDTVLEPVFTNKCVKEAIRKVTGAINEKTDRITIDPNSYSVVIDGQPEVLLSPQLFRLMTAIYRRNGKIVSFERLKREVWDSHDQDIEDASIKKAASRLRKELGLSDFSSVEIVCRDRHVRLVMK